MQIELGIAENTGARRVTIQAPAKLNLYLEILGKRPDGFHELETLMCPISICDVVSVELHSSSQILLKVERESPPNLAASCLSRQMDPQWESGRDHDPAGDIPAGDDNLVVRAAKAVRECLGLKQGCRISLKKRIPAAAGMGGGSSDAAATVVACLALWSGWNRELATKICASLGSDIPFFLGDQQRIGLCFATGRGERCQLLSVQPKLGFIVTHPPAGCSTKQIFAGYRRLSNPRDSEKIIAACQTGQTRKIGAELFNALQFSASSSSMWVKRQLELLAECGNEFTLMTGSGSSCFALLETLEEPVGGSKIVETVARRASRMGIHRVYSTSAWYASSIEQQLQSDLDRPTRILGQ